MPDVLLHTGKRLLSAKNRITRRKANRKALTEKLPKRLFCEPKQTKNIMNFTSTITARLMCMPMCMCMCQTIHVSPVSCAQKVRKPKT